LDGDAVQPVEQLRVVAYEQQVAGTLAAPVGGGVKEEGRQEAEH
jgi:hypothetical protein